MITIAVKNNADHQPATDRFFDRHLAGVRARLEAQTQKALLRQRDAWRDTLHREALLEDKDFKAAGPD
jgi:hypothetical protein